MNKNKYLFKNIGLFTISQFGTKLLSFFLVPLYTSVLTTTEYGTYDLYSSTVSLLLPIVTLSLTDGILIFGLDEINDKKSIISIALKYASLGFIIVLLFSAINRIFNIIPVFCEYWYYLPILLFLSISNHYLIALAKSLDKVKETAISGVLCSVIMIGLNILLLLVVKSGLQGYFISFISGTFAQILYLFICCKGWNYISVPQNKNLEKAMLAYSIPIIFNTIGWWINNSSDRYIVTWLCGVAANGIYSVGYKIPSILSTFQSIFASAWTISAVKDFDKNDADGFFSKTYSYYNCVVVIICALIIATTKILAYFLYAKDFYTAWQYVPFLTISIVFGALSGHLGGIFSANKDSKIFASSTVLGAVLNTILNIVLVYFMGPVGAAISTMVSFFAVWLIRYFHVKKYIKLNIRIYRDLISYIMLLVMSVLLFIIDNEIVLCSFELVALGIIWILFKDDIKMVIEKIAKRTKV